jgi:hypothetical protein
MLSIGSMIADPDEARPGGSAWERRRLQRGRSDPGRGTAAVRSPPVRLCPDVPSACSRSSDPPELAVPVDEEAGTVNRPVGGLASVVGGGSGRCRSSGFMLRTARLMKSRLMKRTAETPSSVSTGPVRLPRRRSLAFMERAISPAGLLDALGVGCLPAVRRLDPTHLLPSGPVRLHTF